MSITANCPVCGRGYHPSVWKKMNPRTWRLGVKQDPRRRFQVIGNVLNPEELPEGIFELMKMRLINGLVDWIFWGRIDLGDFLQELARKIQVFWYAGRKVVHIWTDVENVGKTVHEVEHSFNFRRLQKKSVEPAMEITHDFRFKR